MKIKGTRKKLFNAREECEIIALAAQGLGYRRIALSLKLGKCRVRRFMAERGLSQKVGGTRIPKEKREAIAEAAARRENFGVQLAKKYGVSPSTALRIAHDTLGTGKFLSSPYAWPPLQSPFPQNSFDAKSTPDAFVQFVEKICAEYFNGKLPPLDDASFVEAMVSGNILLRDQPKPILDAFAVSLLVALDCVRRERNAIWTN